jgi:uncharacterized protein YkwD
MPLSRRAPLLLALFLAVLSASPARAADDPYADLLAPPGACGDAADALVLSPADAEQAMLCLTNYARARSGLAALRANAALDQAGQAKLAADVSCGEFSHTPCGKPFTSVFAPYLAGMLGYTAGENIAWGTGEYSTPRGTMAIWLHSDGHRENILRPAFRDLGIGYLPNQTFEGSSGAALWSQEFGARTPAPAPPKTAKTAKTAKTHRLVYHEPRLILRRA